MTIYHIPGNEQLIDEVYIVLSKDNQGEGIVSIITEEGAFPMIFGHKRMLETVREYIKKSAKETGQTLHICKFKKIEIIEEINGSN